MNMKSIRQFGRRFFRSWFEPTPEKQDDWNQKTEEIIKNLRSEGDIFRANYLRNASNTIKKFLKDEENKMKV